jgi:hypothetical protein
MDIIFGAINADDRAANIARQEQGVYSLISYSGGGRLEFPDTGIDVDSERSYPLRDKGDKV